MSYNGLKYVEEFWSCERLAGFFHIFVVCALNGEYSPEIGHPKG